MTYSLNLEKLRQAGVICIRCWIEKKTVREEWSHWCYVYWDKVADRHMWKSQENKEEIAEFLLNSIQI